MFAGARSTASGVGALQSVAAVAAAVGGGLVAVQPLAGVAVLSLVGLGAWAGLCLRKPDLAFTAVIALVVFSSHVLALAYRLGAPAGLVANAILVKDVLAWVLLVSLAARTVRDRLDAGPLMLVAVVIGLCGFFVVLVHSPAPIAVQIQALRSVLVPVLALGCVAMLRAEERRRASVLCIYLIAVAAAYALIELTLPRAYLIDVIGVGRYWGEVKGQPLFLDPATGLPGNFFTTAGFPRLSGTFGDPLSAGEDLAGALILAVAYRSVLRWRMPVLVVLVAALTLTFTRDGWLLALVGLSAFAIRRQGVLRAGLGIVGGVVTVLLAVRVVKPLQQYATGVLGGDDASTLAHQAALQEVLRFSFPAVGRGWGTAGANALNAYAAAITYENTYLVLLTQVGWVGFALLAVPFSLLAVSAVRRQPMVAVGIAVLLGQAVSGVVSENLLAFNAGFFPFAVAGLVVAGTQPPRPVQADWRRPAMSGASAPQPVVPGAA